MNRSTALRWSGYVAVAVLFALACAMLSNWQFARSAERDAELALVAGNYEQAPVPLAELIPGEDPFDPSDEWRPVLLRGEYLEDEALLVRNRPHGGTSAFEVLVPFRTDDGRVVVVDRGWVPPGRDQPEPDAIPAPPAGEVTVQGRLQPGEKSARDGRSAPEGQVPTIDLPLIGERVGSGDLIDTAYVLMTSEDPAPAERPRALESPSEDPGPHLSYAIQWILFAVMGFGFLTYVIVSERRLRREEDDEDDDELPVPAPEVSVEGRRRVDPVALHRARKRPRDRDADDEDALLDAR